MDWKNLNVGEAEHAANKGAQCPFCGGNETEGGSVDTGGGRATQEMWCHSCENNWVDVYKLVGYQ